MIDRGILLYIGEDIKYVTYFMKPYPSSEAVGCCAPAQEIPYVFCNSDVYFIVHKGSPLAPILSEINPGSTSQSISLRFILKLSTNLRLGFPDSPFPSSFLTNIFNTAKYSPFTPIRSINPAHLILFDLNRKKYQRQKIVPGGWMAAGV